VNCLEARRLVPRLAAMDLPRQAEMELREHLAVCPACRQAAAEREPVLELVAALASGPGPQDDRFVGEVMAEIHQRRLERMLSRRRSRVLAAAAVVLALLGGATVVRQVAWPARQVVARAPVAIARPQVSAATMEPAFVEVDDAGVRLYQLTPTSKSRGAIQVAFIVDPHLEL
jgi:predicted anti-sigma-YlaC factor YlaD